MQISEDGCDMRRFMSFNHSTCKTVLNLLELEWTIEAAMVLAVRTDRAELSDMRIAGLRK